jgi:thymidine phosphorylase
VDRFPASPAIPGWAGLIPQELIRRKRDGGRLADDEIEFIVRGIADGGLTDGQVAAFAMAVFFRDLDDAERVALTGAMTRSGTVLEWDEGPVLDKHSTGGVGDKVSLLLAPIVAACGGKVPMISGRGLGHTGGTLDKLDSIPGYATAPGLDLLRRVVGEAGCAIIGQTPELAPADRRLYALRDATATVESIPLIVASILSKKLAAGLDALVMDVKAGSGAFMPDRDKSAELARAIVAVARGNRLACEALLTDMDQVLGRTAGNAVEVRESIGALTHPRAAEPRLVEVTLALCAALLRLGGLYEDDAAARAAAGAALATGAAAERFARMCAALGGPADLLDDPDRHLARAPHVLEVFPERPGRVRAIAVREIGVAVLELGGGRLREDRAIDHAVGLVDVAGLSEEVGHGGRPLAVVHARDAGGAERAAGRVRAAFEVGEAPAALPPLTEIVA